MIVRFGRTTLPWKVVKRKIGHAGGPKQKKEVLLRLLTHDLMLLAAP